MGYELTNRRLESAIAGMTPETALVVASQISDHPDADEQTRLNHLWAQKTASWLEIKGKDDGST